MGEQGEAIYHTYFACLLPWIAGVYASSSRAAFNNDHRVVIAQLSVMASTASCTSLQFFPVTWDNLQLAVLSF
jgi:hypothetical protein